MARRTMLIVLCLFPLVFGCKDEAPKLKIEKISEEEKSELTGPLLESISGADQLMVISIDGENKIIKAKDFFEIGDSFKTDGNTAARLIYGGGSQVLVSKNSNVVVGASDVNYGKSNLALPSGKIRVLIKSKRDGSKKIFFRLKTGSVAMGVRGTDFIVDANQAETSVHTVSGKVDVAKDIKDLDESAVSVGEGEFTQIKKSEEKIEKPKKFEVPTFLNKINNEDPKMHNLWKVADKDAKTDKVENKFRYLQEEYKKERKLRILNQGDALKDKTGGALEAKENIIKKAPKISKPSTTKIKAVKKEIKLPPKPKLPPNPVVKAPSAPKLPPTPQKPKISPKLPDAPPMPKKKFGF